MRTLLKIFVIQLFLINTTSAKVFQIDGKIIGKENLKFAYAFNSEDGSMIQIVPIVNNAFTLKGEISEHNRFGALPSINVLLLTDSLSVNEIDRRRLTSKRRHYNCDIIAGDHIILTYNTDKKIFTVEGTHQNFVQNFYENRLSQYRNTRDSLINLIRMTDLNPDAKNDKIDQVGADLFTATMRDFIKIVKTYPDEVSLYNFNSIVYDQGIPGKEVLDAFNLFPLEIRNSQYGKGIYKDIEDKLKAEALMAKPAYTIGQQFPKFSLPDSHGNLLIGSKLLGKYTLIDFWATWCGPCRKETPNVLKAYQQFYKKGFKVITVSIDEQGDKQKWMKALADDNMTALHNLYNGSDSSGLARDLKVVAIPMNYLLDEQGKIVAMNLRGEELHKKLQQLLLK